MTGFVVFFFCITLCFLLFLIIVIVNIRRQVATRRRVRGFLIANTLMFPLLIGVALYALQMFNAGALITLFSGRDPTGLVANFLILATFFFIFIIAFIVTEILLIVKLRRTS